MSREDELSISSYELGQQSEPFRRGYFAGYAGRSRAETAVPEWRRGYECGSRDRGLLRRRAADLVRRASFAAALALAALLLPHHARAEEQETVVDLTCRGVFSGPTRPLRGTESASALWVGRCHFFEYGRGTPGRKIVDACRNNRPCSVRARAIPHASITDRADGSRGVFVSYEVVEVYRAKEDE